MQEEVDQKTIALAVKTGKLTAQVLQAAIRKYLAARQKGTGKAHHGQQSLRQLKKDGSALSNIEITDANIGLFKPCAKKYDIDFTLRKDRTTHPPRYMPKMNSKYFAYASKSFDFALMAGVIALVLIGGYIVIQSIFRISINDKIQSYGQLRTIGATPKQIKRIVKNEGRKLGSIGILIGTVLGVCGGFLLFSKGFNAVSYVATVILTLISSWIMISVSIRKPVKIAAGISPIEAVRFTPAQKDIRSRKKNIKLNPVSMGIANFRRDRKKTVAIVASLSLGGIILLVVSSIVLLRSPEALARQFFPDGDYKIYLDSEMTEEKVMAAGNPLNEELKQEILSIDGVTDIIPSRQSLHATYKTEIHQAGGMCDMLTDQNYAAVEAALTEGTMPTDSRSIVIDYNVLKQNEDIRLDPNHRVHE